MTQKTEEQFLSYVRKWGGLASDAALDPECQHYFSKIPGVISYHDFPYCAVAIGDPIAEEQDQLLLAHEFKQFCQERKKNVIFVSTSENFSKKALKNSYQARIEVGREMFLNPSKDPEAGSGEHPRLLRRKVKHGKKEGVEVKEYFGNDPRLENEMEQLASRWLERRRGPQIHISKIRLFSHPEGKRWFYAVKDNKLIGLAILHQLKSKKGWLLNHLMVSQEAPGGTPELIVTTALKTIREEGSQYLTFGMVPANTLRHVEGLGFFKTLLAKLLFYPMKFIFPIQGTSKFWEKFSCNSSPTFLLLGENKLGINELSSLMKTMNVKF